MGASERIVVPMNHEKAPWTWLDTLLARFFNYQEIPSGCEKRGEGSTYLRRFVLKRKDKEKRDEWQFARKYIHHLLRDDADAELHDHPWDFVSFIFWGGYWEEREEVEWVKNPAETGLTASLNSVPRLVRKKRWFGAPCFVFREAKTRHRLTVPRPTWSLVFTSGKKKSWGFFGKDGEYTPWREFLAAKCR